MQSLFWRRESLICEWMASIVAKTVLGDPTNRSLSAICPEARKVVALDCVNAVKNHVQGRKLVEAGTFPDPESLANAEIPVKELLA